MDGNCYLWNQKPKTKKKHIRWATRLTARTYIYAHNCTHKQAPNKTADLKRRYYYLADRRNVTDN